MTTTGTTKSENTYMLNDWSATNDKDNQMVADAFEQGIGDMGYQAIAESGENADAAPEGALENEAAAKEIAEKTKSGDKVVLAMGGESKEMDMFLDAVEEQGGNLSQITVRSHSNANETNMNYIYSEEENKAAWDNINQRVTVEEMEDQNKDTTHGDYVADGYDVSDLGMFQDKAVAEAAGQVNYGDSKGNGSDEADSSEADSDETDSSEADGGGEANSSDTDEKKSDAKSGGGANEGGANEGGK